MVEPGIQERRVSKTQPPHRASRQSEIVPSGEKTRTAGLTTNTSFHFGQVRNLADVS